MTINYHSLLPSVIELVRKAGEAILAIPVTEADAQKKGDGSPVTRADRASHDILVHGLTAVVPEIPVISEEGDPERFSQSTLSRYWLVDPLDGTKEFLKGNGEYTVNVALVDKGNPVLGVIGIPALDLLYWASKGNGVRRQKGKEPAESISAAGTEEPVTAVVSRSHPSPETDAVMKYFPVRHRIERGSSAKMCAVAEGSADLYIRMNPTMLWDTAAGAIIVRESGARVVNRSGNDLLYGLTPDLRQEGFIVYNPKTCSFSEEIIHR